MSTLPPEEESIFNAARGLTDPEKRREHLRVACKGDRAQRSSIEELLSAAEEAEVGERWVARRASRAGGGIAGRFAAASALQARRLSSLD